MLAFFSSVIHAHTCKIGYWQGPRYSCSPPLSGSGQLSFRNPTHLHARVFNPAAPTSQTQRRLGERLRQRDLHKAAGIRRTSWLATLRHRVDQRWPSEAEQRWPSRHSRWVRSEWESELAQGTMTLSAVQEKCGEHSFCWPIEEAAESPIGLP